MAAAVSSLGSSQRVWIPVDVKLHWLSFLDTSELARASETCRSWSSLVSRTLDVQISDVIGSPAPPICRAAKLRLLHRLRRPLDRKNYGYLLAWAAGSRDLTPYLHKLLLLRDQLREDLGLPGGLHEAARPEAYDALPPHLRALWTYRGDGPPGQGTHVHGGTRTSSVTATLGLAAGALGLGSAASHGGAQFLDYLPPGGQPPLVVAASRGNVDAVHLLLAFGEGVHCRRKGNERALYAAAEQGNVAVVAALLGRVPIRPPTHPPHVAERLGLLRPTWGVYGPGFVYQPGVNMGPQSVATVIAATKSRAEAVAATGMSIDGTSTVARGSLTLNGGSSQLRSDSRFLVSMNPVEAAVAQQEMWESDGRYRSWCRGCAMGTYWSLYDSSIGSYQALHGPIGGGAGERARGVTPTGAWQSVHPSPAAAAASSPSSSLQPSDSADTAAGLLRSDLHGTLASTGHRRKGKAAHMSVFVDGEALSDFLQWYASKPAMRQRLALRLAPGSLSLLDPLVSKLLGLGGVRSFADLNTVLGSDGAFSGGLVTPHSSALPLLSSRLPFTMPLSVASRPRPPGHIHPALPPPCDYGRVAAEVLQLVVRLNVGPVEGRSPLHVACDKGRAEIAFLLLSHHDPLKAVSSDVPSLFPRDPPEEALPAAAAAAAAGAGGGGAAVTPAATLTATAAMAAATSAAAEATPAAAAMTSSATAGGASLVPAAVLGPPLGQPLPRPPPTPPSTATTSPSHVSPTSQEMIESIAAASTYALAVPIELLTVSLRSPRRLEETLVELLRVTRDRADPDLAPPGYHTPLCLSSERGDARLVSLLLHWGALVNKPGRKDAAPLLVAAMAGHEHVVALLLKSSCSDASDGTLSSALVKSGMELTTNEPRFSKNAAQSEAVVPHCSVQDRVAHAIAAHNANHAAATAAAAAGGIIATQKNKRARSSIIREVSDVEPGRPEEPSVDTCERSVLIELLRVGEAANAASDGSLKTCPHSSGGAQQLVSALDVRPDMHLPPDEASFHSALDTLENGLPSWMKFAGTSTLRAAKAAVGLGSANGSTDGLTSRHLSRRTGSAAFDASDLVLDDTHETNAASRYENSSMHTSDTLKLTLNNELCRLRCMSRVLSRVGVSPGRDVISVDAPDESGYTALFIFASNGSHKAVDMLIAAGADATITTKRGKSALYAAVERCHVNIVEALLPYYTAHQVRANTTYGTNALHAANKAGSKWIKEALARHCDYWDAKESKRWRAENSSLLLTGEAGREVSKTAIDRHQATSFARLSAGMFAASASSERQVLITASDLHSSSKLPARGRSTLPVSSVSPSMLDSFSAGSRGIPLTQLSHAVTERIYGGDATSKRPMSSGPQRKGREQTRNSVAGSSSRGASLIRSSSHRQSALPLRVSRAEPGGDPTHGLADAVDDSYSNELSNDQKETHRPQTVKAAGSKVSISAAVTASALSPSYDVFDITAAQVPLTYDTAEASSLAALSLPISPPEILEASKRSLLEKAEVPPANGVDKTPKHSRGLSPAGIAALARLGNVAKTQTHNLSQQSRHDATLLDPCSVPVFQGSLSLLQAEASNNHIASSIPTQSTKQNEWSMSFLGTSATADARISSAVATGITNLVKNDSNSQSVYERLAARAKEAELRRMKALEVAEMELKRRTAEARAGLGRVLKSISAAYSSSSQLVSPKPSRIEQTMGREERAANEASSALLQDSTPIVTENGSHSRSVSAVERRAQTLNKTKSEVSVLDFDNRASDPRLAAASTDSPLIQRDREEKATRPLSFSGKPPFPAQSSKIAANSPTSIAEDPTQRRLPFGSAGLMAGLVGTSMAPTKRDTSSDGTTFRRSLSFHVLRQQRQQRDPASEVGSAGNTQALPITDAPRAPDPQSVGSPRRITSANQQIFKYTSRASRASSTGSSVDIDDESSSVRAGPGAAPSFPVSAGVGGSSAAGSAIHAKKLSSLELAATAYLAPPFKLSAPRHTASGSAGSSIVPGPGLGSTVGRGNRERSRSPGRGPGHH